MTRSGVADMVSYEEFREKGYFVVPTAKDWESDPPGFMNFCEDPEAHPLFDPDRQA